MPVAKNSRWKALHRFGPPMLITLGVLWLLQGALARTGSHGVIIRNMNYDAGAVKAGSIVTDTVRLINLSSTPVEVDAQPGCGCTAVDVADMPLAPLHSEAVKLEIDTAGMRKEAQKKGVLLRLHSRQKVWEQVVTVNFLVQ